MVRHLSLAMILVAAACASDGRDATTGPSGGKADDPRGVSFELISSSNVADANFCGDWNVLAKYRIVDPAGLVTEPSSILNLDWRPALTTALRETGPGSEPLNAQQIVTAQYEIALAATRLKLGVVLADPFGNGPLLESCHPIETLADFGLKIDGDKVDMIDADAVYGYFLFGELDPAWLSATDLQYAVYVDATAKTMSVLMTW